jgi:hypothetical protein
LKQDLNEQKSITQKTIASSKRERKMAQEIRVQASSGNVFADLGLENSDKLLVKTELARRFWT